MPSMRKKRLEELFREEISRLIIEELSDPRIGFTTVTSVVLDEDLKRAIVSVSFLLEEGKRSAALAALNSSTGHIRRLLAPFVRMRWMPEIEFRFDESIERSARIAVLIKQARSSDKQPDDAADAKQDEQAEDTGNE